MDKYKICPSCGHENSPNNVECLESGSVFFECKEGPFVPHEEEGVLRLQR